ncbi:MAG: starch-binding protein [Acutalibacteraceae bacterium]|nr:starch-binding protein [Acutalibacteraceae bacterium]
MRKHTLKLCSAVLSVTTLMSSLPLLTSNATEVSSNNNGNNQPFSILEDENGIHFYGTTGDSTLEDDEILDSTTIINSVDNYYEIISRNNSSGKKIFKVKSSASNVASNSLPDSIDNSASEFFPEIGNQGSLGSCTSWAQVYYQFTYTMNKDMNRTTTPENTFSPQWVYNLTAGTSGMVGPYYNSFIIMEKQGNVMLSQVPYDLNCSTLSPDEDIWKTSIKYRLKDYQNLKSIGDENTQITSVDDSELDLIKTSLSNGDVLTYSTYVYSWNCTNLKTNSMAPENDNYDGEYVVKSMTGSSGGHRMTLVGYNDNIWTDINDNDIVDDGEMGAFKVANSWGNDYGNNGFIWVAYDALNQTSCVDGVEENSKRDSIFDEITRIDVLPYNTDANLYLKYTLNSSDRTQTLVSVAAEKNGTEYTAQAISNETLGDKCSYDGTTNANDGTMIFLLNNVVPGINSDNFDEYTWNVTFSDTSADGNIFTVKNAEIVDETTNKTYKPESVYPFTLDGSEKTIEHSETTLNNAVIYYRGYENPIINYKDSNGVWISDTGIYMSANTERRGYTYKYVIELGDSKDVMIYFNDGNGKLDDNNGQYYTAHKGLNYYITENVSEPLTVELTNEFNSIADVDYCGYSNAKATGGYAPYQYQYIYTNLETGEKVVEEYRDSTKSGYFFREVGNYRITVNVMDFTDNVVSASMDVVVEEIPFEITEFYITPKANIIARQELNFTAITNYEHIKAWGNLYNKYDFTIKKENEVCYTTTVNSSKYNIGGMTSTIKLSWTPTQAGSYSITISSTEGNGEYAEKTIYFDVAEYNGTLVVDATNDKRITLADPVMIMRYIVGIVDSSKIWLSLADCDKNGEVSIKDAVYIQKYILAIENSAGVGEINYKEPEPTEPPTEPTTSTESVTEPTTDVEEENIVTFTNSFNWGGTISCYYWSSSNTTMTTWPGKAMTYAGTNSYGESMYTFEVPENATYIIFTNGSAQTTDISYGGGEVRYYPISTTDSKGHYNVATW